MHRDPKQIVDNSNVHQHRKCEPFKPRPKKANETPVKSTDVRRKEKRSVG